MNGIIKCFVFYLTLDEMFSGVERHHSREALSLTTVTGHLLRLKLDINDISILCVFCILLMFYLSQRTNLIIRSYYYYHPTLYYTEYSKT